MRNPEAMDEQAVYRATHRTRATDMGYLFFDRTTSALTHRVDGAAFDALSPTAHGHDWMGRVGTLTTACGLAGWALTDLVPSHADPLCDACRAASSAEPTR